MDDRQEDKLSMYNKLVTFLTEKEADLAGYPIIATIKTKLEGKVNEIVIAEAIATSDNTGYAQVKAQKQADLLKKTLKVGSGAAMYYTVTMPDSSKREKVDYKKSELELMRDSDQYVASKRVHDIADSIKTLLGPFGVTAGDVDALAAARQTFYAVMQMPKEKFAEAVGAGKTVDRLMSETDVILEEELDTQMQIVSVDDIDLYEIYKVARLIDDTGSSGPSVIKTYTLPVAQNMLINAGALEPGTTAIRSTLISGENVRTSISLDGSAVDGVPIVHATPGTITKAVEDFQINGSFVVVENQSASTGANVKIELLG